MRVAILGGTGKFGRALATRLLEANDDVVVGSRDPERARETAERLGCIGAANDRAVADADLAILAVSAGAALATATGLRGSLRSPLLSVAAEVDFSGGAARPPLGRESLAERVAAAVDVPIAAGLHSLAALKLVRSRPEEDALICGDDDGAKTLALEVARHLVAGRAVDAGPLASARALEAMTAVLLSVNSGYKTHAGLRVTGLE